MTEGIDKFAAALNPDAGQLPADSITSSPQETQLDTSAAGLTTELLTPEQSRRMQTEAAQSVGVTAVSSAAEKPLRPMAQEQGDDTADYPWRRTDSAPSDWRSALEGIAAQQAQNEGSGLTDRSPAPVAPAVMETATPINLSQELAPSTHIPEGAWIGPDDSEPVQPGAAYAWKASTQSSRGSASNGGRGSGGIPLEPERSSTWTGVDEEG